LAYYNKGSAHRDHKDFDNLQQHKKYE